MRGKGQGDVCSSIYDDFRACLSAGDGRGVTLSPDWLMQWGQWGKGGGGSPRGHRYRCEV